MLLQLYYLDRFYVYLAADIKDCQFAENLSMLLEHELLSPVLPNINFMNCLWKLPIVGLDLSTFYEEFSKNGLDL